MQNLATRALTLSDANKKDFDFHTGLMQCVNWVMLKLTRYAGSHTNLNYQFLQKYRMKFDAIDM